MGLCLATDNLQRSRGCLLNRHQQDVLKNSQIKKQSNSIHYTPFRKLSYQDLSLFFENFDSTGIKEDSHHVITGFTVTTFQSEQNQQEFEKKISFSYRMITCDQMIQDSIKSRQVRVSCSQSSLKNIYYKCHYCQIQIEKNLIQLSCQHSYHINCLMEMLVNQLNNHSSNIICLCKKQININIFMLFKHGDIMKETLLKNQLNQLVLNEQKKNGIKYCKKCKFIYIEKNKSTECLCVYKK